jgi:AraC family transcriptional regulator
MAIPNNNHRNNLIVRGPSITLSSSIPLGWSGIILEHHIAQLGERADTTSDAPIVQLASGQYLARGERADSRGRYQPYLKPPGTLSVFSGNHLPALRPFTQTDLIGCMLDPIFVRSVAQEQDQALSTQIRDRIGFSDRPLANLIRLLADETESAGECGRLYADHLIYAFVLRLLSLNTNRDGSHAYPRPLKSARLNRVLERMESEFRSNLNLETLASECGYSRNHFLRLFRKTTGYSPHQYLLKLRVKRAKSMMKDKSLNLLEIALACGFSSDVQMSRAFLRTHGVSASQYRRGID